ncbi:MAG: DUF3043 domain-containing protein [Mycobacterium sp.]
MKLLGRKNDDANGTSGSQAGGGVEAADPASTTAGTAPKGRPTPKRSTSKRRGPVAPAPATAAEARKRRKELRSTMTKEERQADKAERRAALATRRERMMDGDEAFLLPRDKGPVRRYVRDIVDSRRNVLGFFMPAALGLIFFSMALPQLQQYMSLAMLAIMLIMGVDAILLSRRVNKAVDAKFPDSGETHLKLGVYASGRATQIRRMRTPRPRVALGDKVD